MKKIKRGSETESNGENPLQIGCSPWRKDRA